MEVSMGIRCTKDQILIAIIEGSKNEPNIKKETDVIKLKAPMTSDSRGEELYYLRKEFLQIIDKYKPNNIGIKDNENSLQRLNPSSVSQRGEVEGIIIFSCYEANIKITKLLYTTIKGLLEFSDKGKKFEHNIVKETFNISTNDSNTLDSILCGWAVLE